MTQGEETPEYNGFRITVVEENGKFVAWTETLDGHQIVTGYTYADRVGTRSYCEASSAMAAAKAAIDSGEIVAHRKP